MVYIFNPLEDPRWGAFVLRHPMASVFHTVGWVQALQRTYRYEPVVYTTSPPDQDLTNGILLCRVCSWLTGRRMVSVPFADHCEPLTSGENERAELMEALRHATAHTWRYVELRPQTAGGCDYPGFERRSSFRLHTLDVRPPLDELFRRFHQSTIQRKIRRAEREGLVYEEGCSMALLHDFYRLLLLTRRRHRVPPQPIEWFANLIACLPDAKIAVAKWNGGAIAAMLTILHGPTLVYKYGCSDARLHHLGGVPWLFWKAIADAKARGATSFDLGRSDLGNAGLITFKDRLGATSDSLSYIRAPSNHRRKKEQSRWWTGLPAQILSRLPDRVFTSAGRLLYPHAG